MPAVPNIGDVVNKPGGFTPIVPNKPNVTNPRVPSADDVPESPAKSRPVVAVSPNPVTVTQQGRLLYDKFIFNETKFTSLKFTGDSFNGANTSEPLIQKSISIPRLGRIASPRVFARENQERVALLLNTTGRGFRFIQNQKNLTFSNSRLESTGNQSSKLRFTSLAFYDPNVTLAQIGRDPSEQGEHYTRFGISPFMDDSLKYSGVVTKNNTPGVNSSNRLWNLRKNLGVSFEVDENNKLLNNTFTDYSAATRGILQGLGNFSNAITGIVNLFGGDQRITNVTRKITGVTRTAVNYLTPYIDQYQGGPGSFKGIGTTTIRRFDYTNDPIKNDLILKLVQNKVPASPQPLGKISDPKFDLVNKTTKANERKVQELETTQYTKIEKTSATATGYTYKFSNPFPNDISSNRIRNKNTIEWTRNDGAGNWNSLLSLTSSARSIKNGKLKNVYDDNGIEDISEKSDRMPIIFKILDPFTGDISETWKFSAYLNGFKDTSTPKHTEISYIGRSEYFYVYDKFTRSVSFNFQIPCYNLADLRSKHKALSALYSSTMGKYQNNKLGGILYYLTVGSYLDNETGIITNISYDIPNDSPWDIDEQLAHNLNVSISYTVIHSFLPQYDEYGNNLFTIREEFKTLPINKYDIKLLNSKTPELPVNIKQPTIASLPSNLSNSFQIPSNSSNNFQIPKKSSGGMVGGANQ
jgi:hypothetical protein